MKGTVKRVLSAGALFVAIALVYASPVLAKTHNVTYVYGEKTVTYKVKHGQNAPVPTDTYVPGYTFVNWTGSAANVTEDRVILGAYNKDTYNVTGPDNYRAASYTTDYRFKVNNNKSAPWPEWWKDLNMPKGQPGVTCAVHWYNGWNGEYWKTDIVPYGGSAPLPDAPCIEGYDFVGWEGDWTNVTEDRAIRAWYYEKHKVSFYDNYDREWIDTVWVRDGEEAMIEHPHHKGQRFDDFYYKDGVRYDESNGIHADNVNLYANYNKKR
ncbi:MAG: InlB B-repeat-containing protein [Lachnospiraceae bacterium]|nr:InlB B-repeat-containing protein [Lachnospiraceae bacterium]